MSTQRISFLSRILNTLVPPRCAICGRRLTVGEKVICGRCNLRLPRTYYEKNPYDNPMCKLFWGRFHVEKCPALFFYYPHTKSTNVIKQMKYYNHPEYGFQLGVLIATQFMTVGFFDGITAVMPLPLARNRERKRGYNQSREIARGICSIVGLPMIDKAVSRSKYLDTQTHKSRQERAENVEHAFSLVNPDAFRGQHVLIIDDVATTGATITACAREIEKAGDVKISVVTAGLAGQS